MKDKNTAKSFILWKFTYTWKVISLPPRVQLTLEMSFLTPPKVDCIIFGISPYLLCFNFLLNKGAVVDAYY